MRIFPIIDLGDYILREKQESDIEDFYRYFSDPEVNKYIISDIPRNLEEARLELHYWRNIFYKGDGIYFAITRKDNNQLIGSIGFTSKNTQHNKIELSYDLAKEYWHQGIMTKAVNAICQYGFEEMKMNRVEAFMASQNFASRKLLEKCGFTNEGLLRENRLHQGNYVDVYIYSLLWSDFFLPKIKNN